MPREFKNILRKQPMQKILRKALRGKRMNNGASVRAYRYGRINKKKVLIEFAKNEEISTAMYTTLHEIPQNMQVCIAYSGKKEPLEKQLKKVEGLQILWVKRGSSAYYRALSQALWVINENYCRRDWVKKAGQYYLKIENSRSLTFYRKKALNTCEGRCRQIDCFQADFFLCSDEETAERLRNAETLRNFCKAKIYTIKNEKIDRKHVLEFPYNGKENVLIYGSALEQNGITSSLVSMLQRIDRNERNYCVCVKFPDGCKTDRIGIFPKNTGFKAMEISYTPEELFAEICYYKFNINSVILKKVLERMYRREYRRNFSNMRIDIKLQFTGYESDVMHLFSMGDTKNAIYVHNDMEREMQLKKFQHRTTLESMYRKYDAVVLVNEELLESTRRIGGRDAACKIVNNFFNDALVREKAERAIEFDKDTISSRPLEEIERLLGSNKEKFITIGRFSKEKGHFMLLEAFAEYHRNHPNSCLFIIGGCGTLYDKTVEYAAGLGIEKEVTLIKGMSNPMSVLKKCDLFLLSSLYEGFGLVVLEAAALDVPVVTTDIVGPAKFVKNHGGTVVECSKEGILKGMEEYRQGNVKAMEVDFDNYNDICVKQLKEIL